MAGKYVQLGEVAVGSAVELSGTIITPFGAYRGHLEPNAFENAVFLWETGQQHACTTYQALLQTPLMVPAVGMLKQAVAALETQERHAPSRQAHIVGSGLIGQL